MTRLPDVGDEPEDPRIARVWARFAREGRPPIALYRALANAPHLLEPYSALAQALRHDAATDRDLRELCILRVAHLTGSEYEWAHHRKMAADLGMAPAKVRAVLDPAAATALDERDRLALRLVDEAHRLAVSDETVTLLLEHFSPAAVAELMLLTSLYEAIARLIQALGLPVEAEYQPYLGVP